MRNFIFLVSCLLSSGCFAMSFEKALGLYQEKKFEQAYAGFTELAEYGNTSAQFNIAVMFARGEFVKQDLIESYAWFAFLDENGFESAKKMKGILAKKLIDKELPKAKERQLAIAEKYSRDAVDRKFMPRSEMTDQKLLVPAKPIYNAKPSYPKSMSRKGMSGTVDVQFLVGRDGSTRFHKVLSTTEKGFNRNTLEAAKANRYQPAKKSGEAIEEFGHLIRFTYAMNGAKLDKKRLNKLIEPYKKDAMEGGGYHKYMYARVLKAVKPMVRTLKNNEGVQLDSPTKWFAESARFGFAYGKYELGRSLAYGKSCSIEPEKSTFWLEQAAEDGVVEAQFMLGAEYISGAVLRKDETLGIKWVTKAADNNMPEAQVKLAWVLATHKDGKIRDLEKAEMYLSKVNQKKFVDKRTLYETWAALTNNKESYSDAQKWIKKSIKESNKYDQPTDVSDAIDKAMNQKRLYLDT